MMELMPFMFFAGIVIIIVVCAIYAIRQFDNYESYDKRFNSRKPYKNNIESILDYIEQKQEMDKKLEYLIKACTASLICAILILYLQFMD